MCDIWADCSCGDACRCGSSCTCGEVSRDYLDSVKKNACKFKTCSCGPTCSCGSDCTCSDEGGLKSDSDWITYAKDLKLTKGVSPSKCPVENCKCKTDGGPCLCGDNCKC